MAHPSIAGRLVSVNVGMPADVQWRGQRVHTGIWKSPVPGPVMVRRLNIDGDGQGDLAGHGGEMRAVMVYQLASYRHWAAELGRDDLVHGNFGENLTVDGLADAEVCIGDRFRIGDAVFEVTQPRVTCYRVGIRMNEPRMAALLVAHGRPGFYFRVIEEGEIAAGQEIVKVADGPESMPVTVVDRLLYTGDRPADQLARALRIEALSPGWKESFRALLGGSAGTGNVGLTAAAAAPPPAWAGFRPLAVAGIRRESADVISIRLADPAGHPLPAALPGQYLTVRVPPEHPGEPALIRDYSLSGAPGAPEYRIGVKAEPHGGASNRLHRSLRAGDRLEAAAPRGTFLLADDTAPVLLISAGIGVTPMLAMLRSLADRNSTREIWWLHGARNGAEQPFADEAREQLKRLPGSHFRICYSRPAAGDRPGADYTDTGHIDAALLDRLGLPRDAYAYLCGPNPFMASVIDALAALGLDRRRIRTEIFGAEPGSTPGIAATPARPPHQPPGAPADGFAVTFARSGLTTGYDTGRYASILELAEACDVPVRWSCRTGVCHTCETPLGSGHVAYDPDPLDPPANGDVLLCCSVPAEDIVLDL
ncbi:MOSC and FAD-binding oxidoreductase domain-containing protein [Nocardia sp. BMG111209]|uniref:MOSC and FAD-binding oxidoreductase domain-containing protein n=1 Tax=Nocardia sp. BMG111209 TaxID=1160137 RepID=UPI000372FC07|nr:MOSC and FAD-binding oxidoreductase domain-containing protein [Nocardia sp. BMG111209]